MQLHRAAEAIKDVERRLETSEKSRREHLQVRFPDKLPIADPSLGSTGFDAVRTYVTHHRTVGYGSA